MSKNFNITITEVLKTTVEVVDAENLEEAIQTVKDQYRDQEIILTTDDFTNPRSQGCPRFQSGEELANSVGKINAYYSL